MSRARYAVAMLVAGAAASQTVTPFALVEMIQDHQSESTLVHLGSDNFVVAWSDERVAPGIDIYGNVISTDAEPVGEFDICDNGADQGLPQIAYSSTDNLALVVFRDSRGSPADIYGQWLSTNPEVVATGTATSSNFAVQAVGGYQDFPRVAFGGGVFLVILQDGLLDSNGSATCSVSEGNCIDTAVKIFNPGETTAVASTTIPLAGAQVGASAAWDDSSSGFIVVWEDRRNDANENGVCDKAEGTCTDIRAQVVDATGALVGDEMIVSDAANDQRDPSIASIGATSLIVWEDSRNANVTDWDAYGRLVVDGTLAEAEIVLSDAEAYQRAPRVAGCASDDRYVVAFQDTRGAAFSSAWLQAVESDGSLYGSNFSLGVAAGAQNDITIMCGDSTLVLTWTDWRNSTNPGPDEYPGTFDDPTSDLYGAFVELDTAPNNPPAQPENVEPSSGAVDVSLAPALSASVFVDIDDDTHASSRWEICADSDCKSVLYDSGDVEDLLSHNAPAGKLDIETMYYWRVRYTDGAGRTSLPSAPTSFTTVLNQPPGKPSIVSPVDDATDVSTAPTVSASEYSDPDEDKPISSEWQFCSDAYCTNVPVLLIDGKAPIHEHTLQGKELLQPLTTYLLRVRYQDARGALSDWSDLVTFTTREENAPAQPQNVNPADAAVDVDVNTVVLEASAFSDPDGDTHAASEWAVCIDTSCRYALYESGVLTTDLVSHAVAMGLLRSGNVYHWRVRYQDSTERWSEWSLATSFTTVAGEAVAGEDGGCGCRVGGREKSASLPVLLFGAIGTWAALRTRRRHRNQMKAA